MTESTVVSQLRVHAADGAGVRVQVHRPARPTAAIYWLPALGVGIGPNEPLASELSARGVAVAIHEWRGLGESDRRASRSCDWGYRELLDFDIRAGIAAARAAIDVDAWYLGGHSLGGQLALIEAARAPEVIRGCLLVASGQPHWRAFPRWKALGVAAFASAVPLISAAAGHFPGSRVGFAGREAARLMREWAGTARRGDYRIAGYGDALNEALASHVKPVLAIRMADDGLAPPGAIARLQRLTPRARWQVRDLGRQHFERRRPDHFGWLREPGPVVDHFDAWRADLSAQTDATAAAI